MLPNRYRYVRAAPGNQYKQRYLNGVGFNVFLSSLIRQSGKNVCVVFCMRGPASQCFSFFFHYFLFSEHTTILYTVCLVFSSFVSDEPVSFYLFYCVRGRRFFLFFLLCKICIIFFGFRLSGSA